MSKKSQSTKNGFQNRFKVFKNQNLKTRIFFVFCKSKTQQQPSSFGFTLVELIIYMALLSAFLLILTNIFIAVLNIRIASQTSSNVDQDGRFILARLAYDINRASSDAVPNSTTLNLTIASQTYTYTLSGNNLQLIQPSALTDNLNGSGVIVTNLSFQKVANPGGREDTIKIQFMLQGVASAGNIETRSFITTLGRRIR